MRDDPSRFTRYGADFDAYAAEVARMHLTSSQRKILLGLQEHDRVAVKAGNAVGKTAAVGFVMQHHLAGGPGSVVVSTSATEAQLRRVLWRELRSQFKRTGHFFNPSTVMETEIRLADDWFAVGFSTDVPEAMQGIHAERILVVVDEASGVSEDIYDAIEGVLAGGQAKLLIVGNPLRTSGTFFDAFNSRRDEFHTLTISAFDTPNFTGEDVPRGLRKRLVQPRWVERLEKREAGSNAYRIKVLGEFPAQADDTVISLDDLTQAQTATLEPGLPLVLGLDVARYGSDETVLALREGNRIRILDAWHGRSLMETTGRVIEHARRLQIERARRPRIVIDDAGVGGGVTDRLREQGFNVVGFNGGSRARHSNDYPNRRSELWFDCSEVLPALDLDPADEELGRELLAPSYSFDSSGARVVEQKSNTRKRLRRSPDRADAILLTLAVDPPKAPGRRRSLPTVSVPTGTILEPESGRSSGTSLRRIAAAFDRRLIPGATTEKAPPPDVAKGGFVWNGAGDHPEPERPPCEVSQAGLLAMAMRGVSFGSKRPRDPGASLAEISELTGIPMTWGEIGGGS